MSLYNVQHALFHLRHSVFARDRIQGLFPCLLKLSDPSLCHLRHVCSLYLKGLLPEAFEVEICNVAGYVAVT